MTESSFPFATADVPESEGGQDKRKLALVLVAGALVVAVLGYFVVLPMLSGSSSDNGPVAVVVHKSKKAKTTTAKAAAKPAVAVVRPATFADVSARKDPFAPLVVPPVVSSAAPAAPGTTGTTTTTPSGSSSSSTVGGQRVALVKVYSKSGKEYAQTKVGDTVFTPAVGDVFAGSYKLLATSGTSATYLFGDEQFSLTEGQEVLK